MNTSIVKYHLRRLWNEAHVWDSETRVALEEAMKAVQNQELNKEHMSRDTTTTDKSIPPEME